MDAGRCTEKGARGKAQRTVMDCLLCRTDSWPAAHRRRPEGDDGDDGDDEGGDDGQSKPKYAVGVRMCR